MEKCPTGAVVEPSTEIITVETQEPVPWHHTVLPAIGNAVTRVGRELVPRLAPLALDALQSALDRRELQQPAAKKDTPASTSGERGRGRQKRRRRRNRGRPFD